MRLGPDSPPGPPAHLYEVRVIKVKAALSKNSKNVVLHSIWPCCTVICHRLKKKIECQMLEVVKYQNLAGMNRD